MEDRIRQSPFPSDFPAISQEEEERLIALAVGPSSADSMLSLFRIYASDNVVGFMRFSRALLAPDAST